MQGWMSDMARENAEVRKEIGRLNGKTQESWQELKRMRGEVQEAREETQRVRKEADEGRGELKKCLARMSNENRNGDLIGSKYLAAVMDSITRLVANHNVSREDHKSIYRELTMLETSMGSMVRGTVSEVTEKLRWELKRIFEALSEEAPEREASKSESAEESADSDSDTETEERKDLPAWRKGYRGTIGRRRGIQEELGKAGNPIDLVTPAKTKDQTPKPKHKAGVAGMETTARKLKTESITTTRSTITRTHNTGTETAKRSRSWES